MRNTIARKRSVALIAVVVAAGIWVASCSDDDPIERRTATPMAGATAISHVQRDTSEFAGDVALDSGAARPRIRWLNDANVLSLLTLMNSRQTAAADVELESWHLENVRAFAATMAREHAELQHSVDSLSEKLRIAPIAPALAQRIGAQMQAQIDTLRWRPGRSVDRAFLREQVASHALMGDYVTNLTGVAEQPEVQSLLASTNQRIASQLSRARALLASITSADSIAAADSAAKAAARLAAKRARGAGQR